MRPTRSGLSAERAREMLNYDPETGVFLAARDSHTRSAGDPAGTTRHDGYVRVRVDGVQYLAHRLAWLIVLGEWPSGILDHINGNPADNRISNLRQANYSQNSANAKRNRRNKSGQRGVHYCKARRRWLATMTLNGRYVHIGSFLTQQEAVKARVDAGVDAHGEFYANRPSGIRPARGTT
jgi:hypothetical protein